jgi:formylglycine-generating enzyme required for sulfatase activity
LLGGIGASLLGRSQLSGSQLKPPAAEAPFDAARARGHQEAWAGHLGVGVDVTNSVGMRLTLIPPGTFSMGAEDGNPRRIPVHEVRISQPFFLGMHEVTNAQWRRVMGSTPSHWEDEDRPVEHVTWDDAMDFCRHLSELPAERAAGRVYRLPTEAEWEYACRAGTNTSFSFGEDSSLLDDHGWFAGNSGMMTHPVGLKTPNPWGLHDMHGNVGEWCSDWYHVYPSFAVADPQGPPGGTMRVRRGGGWISPAEDCVSVNRIRNAPAFHNDRLGLRVVLTWTTPPSW